MSATRLSQSLNVIDLSDPKNGTHAINLVVDAVENALKAKYTNAIIEQIRHNPIVTVKENFDDLLFPIDNAGRSSRYTRYVTKDTILRTHTSSAIPGYLNNLSKGSINDVIVTLPGMCYRRDVVDKTHCGEPHQMDVWRISKTHRFEQTDLLELVETILNSVIPDCIYRANKVQHPYTMDGLEIEIFIDGNWLEVLECGLAHPTVLMNAGLDPNLYSGLALGMGLDRLVMIIKNINDIRVLRSTDPRIVKQMKNLDPYIQVSNQPPAVRVLSYSTTMDKTEEDVCEEIRDELTSNVAFLEKIEYQEMAYSDLTDKAKENLGINPNQKNVIATLTFRSLDNSLPRTMVNEWVKDLYPKLNQGTRGYM